ncbi:MAG: hypothetical protein ABI625_01530 [bacterium]
MKRTTHILALLILLGACSTETTTANDIGAERSGATSDSAMSQTEEQKDLTTLRGVTSSFHQFSAAQAAGWSAQITPCMSDPVLGGMGFHYGNPAIIDGTVSVDKPELLLYEPEANGRLQLVAVEYIVPLDEWTSSQPPRLFGRDFKVNATFHVWALHVWVWERNPSGLYADWNPVITCKNTTDVSTMSHQ